MDDQKADIVVFLLEQLEIAMKRVATAVETLNKNLGKLSPDPISAKNQAALVRLPLARDGPGMLFPARLALIVLIHGLFSRSSTS